MRKRLFILTGLLFLCIQVIIAQTLDVNGRVLDNEGKPVIGATVQERNSSRGTTTDENGNFRLSTRQGATLVISSVGFDRREVVVGSSPTINITLTASDASLSEVVVTAMGIRRTDKALGYSIGKIDPELVTQKSEPDLLKGLQGKVAGVDIRTSQGTPGAATRIQVRGNSSFFGDNQPLIIVDGIPYSNQQVTTSNQLSGGTAYSSGLSNLDPNDIESINILKGSSAAALYGSRASNGVVLITTKSGSAARSRKGMEITFKSSASIERIANLPVYQNEFGAGSQFGYANANGSWGPAFKDLDSIPVWGSYQAAYPELFPSANIAYRAYPNNVKDLFQTGTVYENSIGFNGGDEKGSIALTASHLNHNGYVPNSRYDRSNIGLGGSTRLNIGLNVRGNLSYSTSKQKGGYFGENQIDGASSQFARSLFLARNWDLNLPFEDNNGFPLIPNGGWDNPRWAAKNNVATTNEERIVAGIHTDFKFNKWLAFNYGIGSNVNFLNRNEVTEIGSRAAEGTGRLIVDNYRRQELESNLLLLFSPVINDEFTLRATLGNNFNQQTVTRQVNTGNKFITRGIHKLQNTKQQVFNTDVFSRRRIIGAFADATLGYKNFAFLNVTGRNDWSSTLPAENRSYFYPSVSGSFIFTDAFNINKNILDFGKIRAGWAKVGRDADPYSLQNVFYIGTNFLGQATGSRDITSFDPNLKPEFTSEVELGTQLSFFKRLVELDLAVYEKTSTNQIAPITVPSSSGYTSFYTNYGKLQNRGIEIDLTLRPLRNKLLNWDIRTAFTKNENKVLELVEGVERLQLRGVLSGSTILAPYLEPGLPFGYLRGNYSLRDDEGNLLINPQTGGMIVSQDEKMIGDPNPDYRLGITNTLSYKGLFLSGLFDITKGGDLYSVTVQSLLGRGVTKDTRDRETAFIIPGVYGDPNTGEAILDGGKKIPNQTAITTNDLYFSPNPDNGATFAINTATEWSVYDATVYRLRELTLGYEIPKTVYNRLPIGSITVTLTGRNLWYLAPGFPKYTRFDPEVNSFGATSTQGIELSAAPTTKRYGINLNVTF